MSFNNLDNRHFSYENELLLVLLMFLGYAIIYFRIEKILKDKIGE
jgi:hypothetical protein